MKKLIILTISMFMLFGITGCSKEQEVLEEPENEAVEETVEDNQLDTSKTADPQPHILENLVVKNVETPTLYITGNRWTWSKEDLQEIWTKNYPYMQVVFGPIADDFWDQGLTWNMTDETLATHYNEQIPKDNRIDVGDQRSADDIGICSYSVVHETGHIWLQNLNDGLQFDAGQWIWEGNTLLFEEIAGFENFDPEHRANFQIPNFYDLYNYAGGDIVNGCWTDGDRAGDGRSLADSNATLALFYLDTALSTPGTYDYWQKVSIERTKYAQENNLTATNPEALTQIMDKVANGKTMDGMGPGEWLFSRSVANTNGSNGIHLGVFGQYWGYCEDKEGNKVSPYGQDISMGVAAYLISRKDGKETALEGTEVNFDAYDCFGTKIGSNKAIVDNNGYVENVSLKDEHSGEITWTFFPEYSAIKYVATTTIDGQEYSDINFAVNTAPNDFVSRTDNRMFFILINEDETINTKLTDIEVSGALGVDKSHLNQGLLIVQANQGDNVTVNGQEYTKPVGARTIPFIVTSK